MLDSVIAFLWSSDMGGQTFVGDEFPQNEAQSFIDLIYQTTDGYISVAVQSDKEWEGLTRALERPEWLADERFATAALRHRNIDARLELTQEVLRTRSSAVWLERLEAEDVPCVPVLKRRDMVRHPQVLESRTLVESDHPRAGRLRQARPAAVFSEAPAGIRFGGPALGEHNDELLGQLGFETAEIDALRAGGVIGRRPEDGAA
jgi:crotonobetainyl-CoA:carnitine CoA-transferase CaiB-like acyl-CoA transferase